MPLQATTLAPVPLSPIEDLDGSWHSLTRNFSSSMLASALVNLTTWIFCGWMESVRKQVWKLLVCGTGQADRVLTAIRPFTRPGMTGAPTLPSPTPHDFGLSQGCCSGKAWL